HFIRILRNHCEGRSVGIQLPIKRGYQQRPTGIPDTEERESSGFVGKPLVPRICNSGCRRRNSIATYQIFKAQTTAGKIVLPSYYLLQLPERPQAMDHWNQK